MYSSKLRAARRCTRKTLSNLGPSPNFAQQKKMISLYLSNILELKFDPGSQVRGQDQTLSAFISLFGPVQTEKRLLKVEPKHSLLGFHCRNFFLERLWKPLSGTDFVLLFRLGVNAKFRDLRNFNSRDATFMSDEETYHPTKLISAVVMVNKKQFP